MGIFQVLGQNASPLPPAPIDFVPAPAPDIPGRAKDADDSGALFWDHDDAGGNGAKGNDGAPGVKGRDGQPGGSTPLGATITIAGEIKGSYPVHIAGGFGQPGGQGGRGGDGGRGQDGGHPDDEQPAGAGGQGGRGGTGGLGGKGGDGGHIFQVDITIGKGIDPSLVAVNYTQGIGGSGGSGGDPGNGGAPGNDGNGNPGPHGFQGDHGGFGGRGTDGIVTPYNQLVG